MHKSAYTVGLVGNPNVGKSTVFNRLTGLNQHTGNWTGKTVDTAVGTYTHAQKMYTVIDTPGTYSLCVGSQEEEITRDFLNSGACDVVVVVADATCLARNLILLLQVLEITKEVVLCLNLTDEAKKKGITIDTKALQDRLGIPIVCTGARSGYGLEKLKGAVQIACAVAANTPRAPLPPSTPAQKISQSERIFADCVTVPENAHAVDRKTDAILTHPLWGTLSMLALLFVIFYITMVGANYPSQLLQNLLFGFEEKLYIWFAFLPDWAQALFISGVYKTLAWVVSVMLPPMAIFFPLFTLLEDAGFLPRIALNMDKAFRCAGAHGKQSLTMCMGFGCNACGVTGCRIIDSPRERLVAILTNTLVPCNGRFPLLIALITMFFTFDADGAGLLSGLILLGWILLAVGMTLLASYFLTHTFLRGSPSAFTLELPPYRMPQVGKVLVRSVLDRTLLVLGRAATVAAPAGALIWLLANIKIADTSLLLHISTFLDPFARIFGLDGMILMAFILGMPANEIVLPILLMGYTATGTLSQTASLSQVHMLLIENGWTWVTAVCVCLFSLFHFPCATTLWTIYKETGSAKRTALAFFLPTCIGLVLCFLTAQIFA